MQDLINELFTLNEYQLSKLEEYIKELKNPKKNRSLSQNAYFWKLCNEIGNKTSIDKEEVHLNMLKHYGQITSVLMLREINPSGFFKYYDIDSIREMNNKQFNVIRVYKGSSEMDTNEMRILLEGTIQEAEQVGIHTLSMEEIENMRLI